MTFVQRTHALRVVSALFAAVLTASTGVAAAQQADSAPTPLEQLDEATQEAVRLEQEIQDLEADRAAIATRLDVVDGRIQAQRLQLEQARAALRAARDAYGRRVVGMYKTGSASPILMLLEARSIEDLIARSSLLGRIATQDKLLWEESAVCAAEAHYQSSVLEDLHAQESELRDINESRRLTLQRNLDQQQALVSRLSDEAADYLRALRARQANSRQDWIDSSLPLDTEFRFVPATVDPHVGITYLVPDHQPLRYESTGDSSVMVCSWYGPGFHGKTTASGQVFNENDFTCASKTLPFGTRLALTRGARRIIVVVTDRGPFIAGRDLDLSKAAAAALGFSGVEPVHVEFVLAAGE